MSKKKYTHSNPTQHLIESTSKPHFDDKSHRTRTNRAPQAIDTSLRAVVRIFDQFCVRRDSRALIHIRQTHAQTLNRLLGFLRLNTGHIPTRQLLVFDIRKVKLTPSRAIPAVLVLRDGVARRHGKPTLRILIKCNVDDLIGVQGEVQRRVPVPARHGAIGTDLVPEQDHPGLGVWCFWAVNLRNVFVCRCCGAVFYRDDVAAPGFANVTLIGDAVTAGVRSFSKAVEAELAVCGNFIPSSWLVRVWTRTTWVPGMSAVRIGRTRRTNVQTNRRIQRAYFNGSANVDETAFVVVADMLDETVDASMGVTTMVALKTREG